MNSVVFESDAHDTADVPYLKNPMTPEGGVVAIKPFSVALDAVMFEAAPVVTAGVVIVFDEIHAPHEVG